MDHAVQLGGLDPQILHLVAMTIHSQLNGDCEFNQAQQAVFTLNDEQIPDEDTDLLSAVVQDLHGTRGVGEDGWTRHEEHRK